MNKIKKRILAFVLPGLFLPAFVFCGCFKPASPSRENVKINRVIDGDTVELSSGESARYIGIDCPELKRKTDAGWVEVNDPFGPEAKTLNEELVLNGPVSFEFDVCKRDKYGRLLVYCYAQVDGRRVLVQAELLKKGLAYLYTFPPNVKHTSELVEALNEAKEERRGVWSLDLDIDSKDAGQHIGKRKSVTGCVESVFSTPKTLCLKLQGLTVVIFDKDMDTFFKQGIDPASAYQDKVVRVFGLIKKYKGRPEIIISHPSQIEIVNAGDRDVF